MVAYDDYRRGRPSQDAQQLCRKVGYSGYNGVAQRMQCLQKLRKMLWWDQDQAASRLKRRSSSSSATPAQQPLPLLAERGCGGAAAQTAADVLAEEGGHHSYPLSPNSDPFVRDMKSSGLKGASLTCYT